MNALAPIRPRLCKLVPMLGSDHDGEIIATAKAIGRTLKAAGLGFTDLAREIETDRPVAQARAVEWEPSSWSELIRWCREHDRGQLAAAERDFVHSVAGRFVMGGKPTEKQAAWLRSIYAKLNGSGPIW